MIMFILRRITQLDNIKIIGVDMYRINMSRNSIRLLNMIPRSEYIKYFSFTHGKECIDGTKFFKYHIDITLTEYGIAYMEMLRL